MTIQEMHYDFKKKLNKVDSQAQRNLLIPEIDWVLNEAQYLFVDLVAQPRMQSHLGFEKSQKNIDDIRTIVVNDFCYNVVATPKFYIAQLFSPLPLPFEYRYFIKGEVLMDKGNCKNIKGRIHIREHDDMFEESPFDKSNFEWRVVNGLFTDQGLQLYSDGTFTITQCCLSYIRNPRLMSNAQNFQGGGYNYPNGTSAPLLQHCELPQQTHREIVDLAVMITAGEIQSGAYQIYDMKAKHNLLGLR